MRKSFGNGQSLLDRFRSGKIQESITPSKEAKILRLIADGYTVQSVADLLGISEKSIRELIAKKQNQPAQYRINKK